MGLKVSEYNPADYIKTPEDEIATIRAALEDYNQAHFQHMMGVLARAQGVSKLAEAASMSREGLYKSLSVAGDPHFSTLLGLLKAMGLRLSIERESEVAPPPKRVRRRSRVRRVEAPPRRAVAA
jgi:probable addiction module antidote protein